MSALRKQPLWFNFCGGTFYQILTSNYFTIPSTMEAKFLHGIVARTMLAFTQFGFGVRALLSDGASANLSLMKILCGHEDASTMAISPWFTSPYNGKKVYLIVCPSHQVR